MKSKNYKVIQNSKKMLDVLYSQRYYYNKANMFELIAMIIILSIGILNFFDFKEPLIKVYINIFLVITNSILFYKIKFYTNRGASLKEFFDDKLFGFNRKNKELDIHCEEYVLDVLKKNRKNYHSQIENDGQGNSPGLKDWYQIINNKNKINSILHMQKQNLYWDEYLSKKYVQCLTCMCIGILAIFLIICYILDYNIFDIIAGIIYFIVLIEYICKKNQSYSSINNNMIKCFTIVEKVKTIDDIIEIQNIINSRRREIFNPPNILHKIFAKELHKRVKIKNDN